MSMFRWGPWVVLGLVQSMTTSCVSGVAGLDEPGAGFATTSSASDLQLSYSPASFGIDRIWDQQGRQLLVPNGAYLIGARSGPDNPDTNYWTKGNSQTHLTNSHGDRGPAYSMRTSQLNPTTIGFEITLGPLPFDFQSLSLSFDWDQSRVHRFRFGGNGFSDDCRPGFFSQSEARFDELPQCHIIRNEQGTVVARAGAAKVRPSSTWVEFEGDFEGKVRINYTSSAGARFSGFFNHSDSHAYGLELADDGAPARQGSVYSISGTIELRATAAPPSPAPSNGGGGGSTGQAAVGSNTLGAGQALQAGQSLRSNNGRYRADMQTDGNFAVYDSSRAIWSTRTEGRANTVALMQGDGNFVLYRNGSEALFHTGTNGRPGAVLVLQDTGAVEVVLNGSVLWSSATASVPGEGGSTNPTDPAPTNPAPAPSDQNVPETASGVTFVRGGTILRGGDAVDSPNGRVRLVMQTDGNLVLLSDGRPVWWTRTDGHAGARVEMQTDGNLVVYQADNRVLWYSHTDGHPGARLAVQDDGNLVIYQGITPIWTR